MKKKRFQLCVHKALIGIAVLGLSFAAYVSAHVSAYAQETTTSATQTLEIKAQEVPAEEGLRFNFRGASLDTVLDYMSKAAGFVIIRNTEVSGRVDVVSHQPLSKEEAVNLLNTILNEKGYTAIRNGRMLTIVKRDEAKTRDIPVRKGSDPQEIGKTDEMVTQIIPVRYADALRLVENIKPLLPSYATISANESSNAIILTDTQANVHRIAEIVKALDTSISEVSTLKVFAVKHADAKEVADLINKIFEQDTTSSSSSDRQRRVQEFISRMRRFRAP